jgi:YD repeat-containing protein
MPLRSCRFVHTRGRVFFFWGISGSIISHSLSVKSLEYPTSPPHLLEFTYSALILRYCPKDLKWVLYTITYDAVGNVIKQTENGLRTTTNTYDEINRNTQVTTKAGTETLNTSTTYDAIGNILTQTDAQGNTTRYEYDELNQRKKLIDAKQQDTDYVYDAVGNIKEIIDTPTRKTSYTYDAQMSKTKNTSSPIANTTNLATSKPSPKTMEAATPAQPNMNMTN